MREMEWYDIEVPYATGWSPLFGYGLALWKYQGELLYARENELLFISTGNLDAQLP